MFNANLNAAEQNLTFLCIFDSIELMLKIRLQRVGRRNISAFRVVITDSQNSAKSGKYLEVLGNYDPVHKTFEAKAERIRYWISKGAQLSETLHNLFVSKKIIDGKKINVLPLKKKTLKRKDLKIKAGEKKSAAPVAGEAQTTPVESKVEVKVEAAPVA